ncbi:uncharacterized protein C1orf198 homolog isoform X2 [Uloborus diversus]|uniref:uncharacterized protein C1orf198 homolog isoform X2 n=1 Tax=Uloborus diversus TaxID=327109 RepID=UPI00240A3E8B|nr:uncharacterized protein C1orf198 homolog isoform X2 [Uloborus diversus]
MLYKYRILNLKYKTMSNTVREKLEAYFASLNSTSNRMMADIQSSREENHQNWENLTPEEQSEILWKSLVKPDALKKYSNVPPKPLDVEYFPILRIKSGDKIIMDDDASSAKSFGCSWRDEHSSPFRWETQSQLDLRISGVDPVPEKPCTLQRESTEKPELKKEEEVKRPAPLKRPEVPPPPVPPHASSPPVPPHAEMPLYAKVVKRKSCSKTLTLGEAKAIQRRLAEEEMKPAVPPRRSLELRSELDLSKYRIQDIDIDGIPKTGFDFLDNW